MALKLRRLFGLVVTACLASSAAAFTPLGNWATWMTTRMHYQMPGDIGGPMNINEEFRYNVPVLYYAFDDTFLSYFGQKGVEEVEKAIAILNALPPMSNANLEDYPFEGRRLNARAQALSLMDLKSVTLGTMVELMGVAESPRYIFCLRDVVDQTCCTSFIVIRRSFDPITGRPSSYINNALYTYRDIFCICTPIQDAYVVNEPVDSLFMGDPIGNMFGLFGRFGNGQYFTGLTRDDVGGLRHIYRRNNQNYETVATGVSGNGAGGAWSVPGGTNSFIREGVRFGIDKVTFARVNYDSLIGETFQGITNSWTDYVITNGVTREQNLSRAVLVPDIVFSGADLLAAVVARGITWTNNPVLNGSVNAGPGMIDPGSFITFNTTGPLVFNANGAYVAETNGIPIYTWGSFDSSTNVTVYPYNETVDALEARIIGATSGGGGSANPWSLPPITFTITTDTGGTGN